MRRIKYPRVLNRPTYIFWRLTHSDVLHIGIVVVAVFLLKSIFEGLSSFFVLGVPAGFIAYKAYIVSTKPRGFDGHLIRFFARKASGSFQLNPGHTLKRIHVVPAVKAKKSTNKSLNEK